MHTEDFIIAVTLLMATGYGVGAIVLWLLEDDRDGEDA